MARSPDVLVVGCGVIGCTVAYELSRRGAAVTLLDDRSPGLGATHASAGMLAPHLEVSHEGPLLELTVRGLERYDSFVERVVRDSGTRVEYHRAGSLSVALPGEDGSGFSARAEALRRCGVAAEALDAVTVRREEPCLVPGVPAGLLIPSHGHVSASQLTEASATAARRLGAQVERAGRVRRVRAEGAGVSVDTTNGSQAAGCVVLAAGSWSAAVEVEGATLALPVHPVRGQLLHLRLDSPILRRITWSDRCYLVPRDDGSVLVGATVEHVGFDERTTVTGVSDLLAAARSVVPCLERAAFLGARAGLRPGTPDGLPVIGPSAVLPQVMYATGHFRNGILLAPLTAELVADALLNGRVDALLEATSPGRFGQV